VVGIEHAWMMDLRGRDGKMQNALITDGVEIAINLMPAGEWPDTCACGNVKKLLAADTTAILKYTCT
jgi:hypothetical protein